MAKKDCPYCEGKKRYFIANTNIEIKPCEFCDKHGEVPKPENFDSKKVPPGLIDRVIGFFEQ